MRIHVGSEEKRLQRADVLEDRLVMCQEHVLEIRKNYPELKKPSVANRKGHECNTSKSSHNQSLYIHLQALQNPFEPGGHEIHVATLARG